MWEHYKQTRIGMQLFIALASVVIFFVFGRSWAIAAGFFATMQVGAIVGLAVVVRRSPDSQRSRSHGLSRRQHLHRHHDRSLPGDRGGAGEGHGLLLARSEPLRPDRVPSLPTATHTRCA